MKKPQKLDNGFWSVAAWNAVKLPSLALLFSIKSLFYLLEGPISRLFRLEKHSLHWPALKWILAPLQWAAMVGFTWLSWHAALVFWQREEIGLPVPSVAIYLAGVVLCSLSFNVIAWLKQHFHSPTIQKKIAGRNAERFVEKIIEGHRSRHPEAIAMHGVLLVFKPDTEQEYSLEADHLLITPKNFFVIETKYKSGTIHVAPTAKFWKVITLQGEGQMRNALEQAKNAARVIQKQLNLPVMPVPIVAIKGNRVALIDAPANVVPAEDLLKVIEAFEESKHDGFFEPSVVGQLLAQFRNCKEAAMKRHIARASTTSRKAELENIVNSASLQ